MRAQAGERVEAPNDGVASVAEPIVPPARDPDAAVQEEFDAALKADTIVGWELFIARHPEHRLRADADIQLQRKSHEALRPKP